jgi:hypothetical protein
MAKKKKPGKKVDDTVAGLQDLDKTISKAMKDMSASINITLSTTIPTQEKKKKKKTQVSGRTPASIMMHKEAHGEYLCNAQGEQDADKMSRTWKKVTCKNCLRVRDNPSKIVTHGLVPK